MTATLRRQADRRAVSMLEIGLVIGLVGLLAVWALPRITGGDEVTSDAYAQSHADLGVEAALAVLRDTGAFRDDPLLLQAYTVDVPVVAADTTSLAPGEVSVGIASPGATLSEVRAATVGEDGTCWLARRGFGTASFEVLYGYARTGTCNADRAASLTPDPTDPEAGSRWHRPIQLTS